MPLAPPLAAALFAAASAGPLEIHSAAVDPARTEAGLRARTGEDLSGWTVTVRDAAEMNAVDVHLRSPDGRTVDRRLVLGGDTAEDRSRDLASSLALLIDQWDVEVDAPQQRPPPPPARPTPEAPTRTPVRGWLGFGPRLELGAGPLLEGAGDLQGGAWLAREHVQPLGSLGVSGAGQGGISLLHVRMGGGLAVGAALPDRRFWLGGHVLLHALWVRAHEARTQTVWSSASELGALFQYRGRRLLVGVRTGVDLTLPPLTFRGTEARIRRGPARWFIGLSLGLVFG